MSASSQIRLPRSTDALDELFHCLSQPLTILQCSLELELSLRLPDDVSIEEIAEHRRESMAVALQQTEQIIAAVRSIRNHLEAKGTKRRRNPS